MRATYLKKRLIPKLLIKHRNLGRVVRPVLVTTHRFERTVEIGDAVSQAKIYQAQMADELVVLNIDGTPIAGDAVMLSLIERLAAETFMPLSVGGGVRTVDDFQQLLEAGADKVSVNTQAVESPSLIYEAARRFGSQCVVVSIDFRVEPSGEARVYVEGARKATERTTVEFARHVAEMGAGEILLTDADRDGTGAGLNLVVCRQVADAVPIPVIVSGGCGLAEHFIEGFVEGGAEAVAAGTFFAFRDQNPIQTRAHMRNAGVPIRMET
jgi:imidazole glycerol-phosphate synthase subunit HisF